ncbi:MAG: relaxase domain-containing protein [Planctomycetales bacterium]|nr:relaxase domain-containing protein [Planctomycetales bacterium]
MTPLHEPGDAARAIDPSRYTYAAMIVNESSIGSGVLSDMLRINQNKHASGAKSYYSTADYYTEGQELSGVWRGEGARRLGLEGPVKKSAWDAVCDNRHPETGGPLTVRTKSERTVGYDFNFHVPKSVSLLYAVTRDGRILEAFRDAVGGTMEDMEAEATTRVRKSGKQENRRTGNLVWGEFIHFTARPLDGLPDPHLHAHCFVFNTTWDDAEQSWKAGQFRELKRDAPYFEAVFHARLAHRLSDLSLPIVRTAKGWELGGVGSELVDKFSRRTAQIEEKARQMGIDDAAAKAELGAKTREHKQKNLSFPELQDAWRGRMTRDELDLLKSLEQRIGGDAEPADDAAAQKAVEHAISHVFERRSVIPERDLLRTALKQGVGRATVEQVCEQAARADLIVGERRGRRMVTTRAVLAEERRVIDFAKRGRGTCKAFAKMYARFRRDWLNDDQKNAVRHVMQSRDRVIMLRGVAGVGKTTLMQEAAEAIEASGTKVFAFAPSAAASRGVLRSDGFKTADTVARLLIDEKLQEQVKGQLIWIDEAGLLGMKTTAQVFDLADRLGARLLLSGDRYQHGSVERGAALRLLEEEAGIKPAEVKEIQRQSGDYKSAVKAFSEGQVLQGIDRLDKLGWVREIPVDQRYRRLADDYLATVVNGETALIVSPTHAEANRVTGEIRQGLRTAGMLDGDERTFTTLENKHLTEAERADVASLHPGDVLVFHQNAKGFQRGDRLTVGGKRSLPLDQAMRFQVFHASSLTLSKGETVRITRNGMTADGKHRLDNGSLYRIKDFDGAGNIVLENGWKIDKGFGHLAYGYVSTSHSGQGKTVDRVFVAQSSVSKGASSREQAYVSVSRGRRQAVIYTHYKPSLYEAIMRSDERLSATELITGRERDFVPVRLMQQELSAEQTRREREGMSHER